MAAMNMYDSPKNTSANNSRTMPMTTRTIAKGIPPRQHKPKGKAKPHTKNGSTKNITKPKKKQSNKHMASDYESDDKEESTSADDSDSTTQGKKKWRHIEDPESENEIVDKDGEPPAKEVEEIDDDDDEDVSSMNHLTCCKGSTGSRVIFKTGRVIKDNS